MTPFEEKIYAEAFNKGLREMVEDIVPYTYVLEALIVPVYTMVEKLPIPEHGKLQDAVGALKAGIDIIAKTVVDQAVDLAATGNQPNASEQAMIAAISAERDFLRGEVEKLRADYNNATTAYNGRQPSHVTGRPKQYTAQKKRYMSIPQQGGGRDRVYRYCAGRLPEMPTTSEVISATGMNRNTVSQYLSGWTNHLDDSARAEMSEHYRKVSS